MDIGRRAKPPWPHSLRASATKASELHHLVVGIRQELAEGRGCPAERRGKLTGGPTNADDRVCGDHPRNDIQNANPARNASAAK
jgi:hypothetical protein